MARLYPSPLVGRASKRGRPRVGHRVPSRDSVGAPNNGNGIIVGRRFAPKSEHIFGSNSAAGSYHKSLALTRETTRVPISLSNRSLVSERNLELR